jgi:hypothetical protein
VSSHKPPRGYRGRGGHTNWSAIIGTTGGITKSRQNTAAKPDSLFGKFVLSQAIQSYKNLPLPPGGFIVCPCTGQSFNDLVRYQSHTTEIVHERYVNAVKSLVPISEPVLTCDLCHTSVVGATEWQNHFNSAGHRAAAEWLRRIEFRTRYVGLPDNFRHPFLTTWDVKIPETTNYFELVDEWERAKLSEPPKSAILVPIGLSQKDSPSSHSSGDPNDTIGAPSEVVPSRKI